MPFFWGGGGEHVRLTVSGSGLPNRAPAFLCGPCVSSPGYVEPTEKSGSKLNWKESEKGTSRYKKKQTQNKRERERERVGTRIKLGSVRHVLSKFWGTRPGSGRATHASISLQDLDVRLEKKVSSQVLDKETFGIPKDGCELKEKRDQTVRSDHLE